MGKFYIDVEKTSKSIDSLRTHKDSLDTQRKELNSVYDNLWLSGETETIKKVLEKLDQNIKLEANEVEFMANALESIVNLYTDAEEAILLHIQPEAVQEPSNNQNPENNGSPEESPVDPGDENSDENADDEPFNVYKWLAEQTGIPQDVLEALAFILSFIPVINCLTDIIDLVNDFCKAWDDHHLDLGEIGLLALDIFSFIGDYKAALKILDGIGDSVKMAKAANTEAKKLSKEAEKAAEKAAERAGKKGKSTVRAANRAKTAAKKADDAKTAAKKVKKMAGKDIVDKVNKEIQDNMRKYIIPGKDNPITGLDKEIYREYVVG